MTTMRSRFIASDSESRVYTIVSTLMPFQDHSGAIHHLFPKDGQPASYVEYDAAVFRGMLAMIYQSQYGEAIPRREQDLASDLIHAIAASAQKRPVWLRCGWSRDGSSVVVDTANSEGGVMVVSPLEIRYEPATSDPPCYFRRPDGIRALPSALPSNQNPLELLQAVAPLPSPDSQLVRLAFLLACLWPDGPYPILSMVGPPESGKGFHAKAIRELVDPVHGGLQGWPRSEEEFLEQAASVRLVVLDNLSQLPPWGVDSLCRLSTGGALRKRRLYHQNAMAAAQIQNPAIVTSVDQVLVTPDLVSRSMSIELPHVGDEGRWDETSALENVKKAAPHILHGLLEIIQKALFISPTEIPASSRITPIFRLMSAAEMHCGLIPGSFVRAYNRIRNTGHDIILAEYAWCQEIPRILADSGGQWQGTYIELLNLLRQRVRHKGDNFPNSPRMLASQIQRTVHSFLDLNISFDLNVTRIRLGKVLRIWC